MKLSVLFFLLLNLSQVSAQKDSLQIGEKYLEDQLYFNISYNLFYKQPQEVKASGFSYGISLGYIRDIPLAKSGKIALGIGIGYGYNSFLSGLRILETNSGFSFEASSLVNNKIIFNNIEFPVQFRLRSSEANKYSFWRLYTGFKFSYNISAKLDYFNTNDELLKGNIDVFNNFQTGLNFSAGYASFNFYLYYGLTPVYKKAKVNLQSINIKTLKLGLSFYLL
ncbi:MAG: porin family protein [Tenacibaculum sp.]